jgi:hypothetical protein
MRQPVLPVLYVLLELGEVVPVRQLLTQGVSLVSLDLPIVLRQMRQPVAPVLLPVSLDQPISQQHVLLRRIGFVWHVLFVLLGQGVVQLVLR